MELGVKVNLVFCYQNSSMWQYKLKVQTLCEACPLYLLSKLSSSAE